MQSLKQLQHRVNEKSPPGICYIVLRNQAPASEDDPPQKRIYMLRKKNTCKENITVLTCTVISIILYEKNLIIMRYTLSLLVLELLYSVVLKN